MKNNINREVTVLLVSDNESDIHEVKTHLEETMGISCRLWYCPSILRSTGFFKKEIPEIDIILLDLGLITTGKPREIFQQMQGIVHGVPIIVFTERADHELALMVIDEGAADNVTRGQFSTDPYKLRDAIEFALARDKISKKTEQKNAVDYRHLEEQSVTDLHDREEHEETALKGVKAEAALVLKEAVEHGNNNLREAVRHAAVILEESVKHGNDELNEAVRHAAVTLKEAMVEAATALKEARQESADRRREKEQIIAWMGGGYSVEKVLA
jgi:FixJ family two-component response regulator